MEPLHRILPNLLNEAAEAGKPARKARQRRPSTRRRTPLGFGTRTLFPPLEILRPAWEHIVGKELMLRTRPVNIVSGRLVVEVPDTRWRMQLVRLEGLFVDRIRHLLGDDPDNSISGIDWKLNPSIRIASEPPRKPPAREADPSICAAAEKIADPELRDLFLREAARMAKS